MSKSYMHELLIMMNMVDGEHKITGAHFKNLTRLETEGEVFEKMGQATSIDLADADQLATAIGPVSAAMVAQVASLTSQLNAASEAGQSLEQTHNELVGTHNEVLAQLQAMTARSADLERELGHVTRERDEAQGREQSLHVAAEAAEQDRQVLLDTLAERTRQIEALQLEVRFLQGRIEQLALAGRQPSAAANLA